VTAIQTDEAHYRKEDLPENQRDSTADVAAKIMDRKRGYADWVSILAPAFQDEKFGVMKQIERLINFQGKPEGVQAWMLGYRYTSNIYHHHC
jgi:hypothetical protein